MHKLLLDLRFAVRQLRKNFGFATTTIVTLALGIGATTAIFSLIYAVLLQPLPFPHPQELVNVTKGTRSNGVTLPESVSYPDFFDWRNQNHSFSGITCYHDRSITMTGHGEARHLDITVVSSEFFRVLGVAPTLGRDFLADDEKPGAHVVILSHQFWASEFGADNNVIGSSITLDGRSYSIAGVMPKDFEFPIETPKRALWTTLAIDAEGKDPQTGQRGFDSLSALGRLKPQVTLDQARADMNVIAARLAAQYPDTNKNNDAATVESELESLVGSRRTALNVLFASVVLLLLISCANVAGLMLARGARRAPEIAVRASLGATRGAITRQVLVESLLLAVCGGIAGVTLAMGLLRAMVPFAPHDMPRLERVSVDWSVLLFALGLSLVTGLLFGVLPARRLARVHPILALRDAARSISSSRGQNRMHNWLVIAETAIGLVLLVGAGLLIHSFVRILNVDPGFNARNILTVRPGLSSDRYDGIKRYEFYNNLLPKLEALPGVQSVAASFPLPLSGEIDISFSIEGRPLAKGDHPSEQLSVITPGFFHTLGIAVLQGREFTPHDGVHEKPVIIINRSFAGKYFPGEDALGKHIQPDLGDGITESTMREVVGIVGDVKRKGLTEVAEPQYYLPFAQAIITSPPICIRAAGDPQLLLNSARARVAELDDSVPLYQVFTFNDLMTRSSAEPRFQMLLLTCFAVIALTLAAVSLYAVLSYMVAQRTVEIGLRMALGAERRDVLTMVLRRGLSLALAGVGIGLIISIFATRLMSSLLYGVRLSDAATYIGVIAVLLLVSLLAAGAPAYRAARLDPMETLRNQ